MFEIDEKLESLKECAAILDQLLNGQSLPDSDDVDAALMRANAVIQGVDERGRNESQAMR